MERRFTAYLIILGLLLGNIFRFSFISPSIQMSILDIAVVFLYLFAFSNSKVKHIKPPIALILFTLWLFTTLILKSTSQNFLVGFSYFFRYLLYIYSYIPLSIIFSKLDLQNIIQALAFAFPLIGLTQYLWFPDLRPFSIYGWDLHYFRVFGTYLDPGFFGLMLLWSLLNLKSIYYWVLGYLVFAFTYSRSSFLSFSLAYTFLFIKIKQYAGVIVILFLIVSSLFLLPRSADGEGVKFERTNSIVSRVNDWQKALTLFRLYPITGVGFNLLRFQYQNSPDWQVGHAVSGIDSSFLFILSTSGLLGFLFYLNFLYSYYRTIKKDPLLIALFLSLLVHSFFLNSQFYPSIIMLYSLIYASRVGILP